MAILGSNQPNRITKPHTTNERPGAPLAPPATPAPAVTKKADRSQQDSVLFGNELKQEAPHIIEENPVLFFKGKDNQGIHREIPISNSVLSRHFMLLGGIGTGKTNAFFQIVSQIKDNLSKDDVMIIFDTKGDFYKEFYRPGDIVISNDETAVGPNGTPDYWNIFNEVADGEQQYASVMEIAKSLFKEACEKTNQVFFPNAARDIFMSTMLHFLRYTRDTGNGQYLNNDSLIDFIKSKSFMKGRNYDKRDHCGAFGSGRYAGRGIFRGGHRLQGHRLPAQGPGGQGQQAQSDRRTHLYPGGSDAGGPARYPRSEDKR